MAAMLAQRTTHFSGCISQLGKGQDYACHGLSEDESGDFHFMVVCDGHGDQFDPTTKKRTNKIIEAFRSDFDGPDWGVVLKGHKKEINSNLTKYMFSLGDTGGIGTTFVGVKIYETHYDVYWIGDSSAWIYENHNRVFANKAHDSNNEEEVQRIVESVTARASVNFEKKGDDMLVQVPSKYFVFTPNDQISMTHSLGHNGITGYFISHHRYHKKKDNIYKIILSSDGFTDVINPERSLGDKKLLENDELSAEDYVKCATEMWKREWGFQIPGYAKTNQRFPSDGYDDIAVELFMETAK